MATNYEELKAKNPYSKENRPEYKNTIFDWLLGGMNNIFGTNFQTGADRYNMEMDMKENETNFQTETAEREELYNSAEQQAMRERAAGINPALAGNTNPGQATEITEPAESWKPEEGKDLDFIKSTINLGRMLTGDFTDIMSLVGSLGKDYVDIRGKLINQDNAEIENAWKTLELALYGNNLYDDVPEDNILEDETTGVIAPSKVEAMPSWYDNLLKSKKNRDKLFNTRKNLLGTVLNDIAKGKRTEDKTESGIWLDDEYAKGIFGIKKAIMANANKKAEIESKYNDIAIKILQEHADKIKCSSIAELEQKINQAKVSGNTVELQELEKVNGQITNAMLQKDKEMQEQDLETIKEYEKTLQGIDWTDKEEWMTTKGRFERRKYMSAMQRQYGTNYSNNSSEGIGFGKHGVTFNKSRQKTN